MENNREMTEWSGYSCVYQTMSNKSITYEKLTRMLHRVGTDEIIYFLITLKFWILCQVILSKIHLQNMAFIELL